MAEFQKIAKARRRMCDACKECNECPLYNLTQGNFCGTKTLNFPEESERIILEWAKANPIKTNRDKFKEVFGVDCTKPLPGGYNAWLNVEYKGGQNEREP